jgi:hypothetical protein
MRNIFFKITNKELETYKLNKIDNFQDVSEKEIISGKKCPSFYNKLDDICCPTEIINNKCVPDKDSGKIKSGGLPICALTYDAASDWLKKNGKIIRLCSEFPPSSKPFERDTVEIECDKNLKLVNNKSLYDVYSSWYLKNQSKVSIKEMLIQLKKEVQTNDLFIFLKIQKKMMMIQNMTVGKKIYLKPQSHLTIFFLMAKMN